MDPLFLWIFAFEDVIFHFCGLDTRKNLLICPRVPRHQRIRAVKSRSKLVGKTSSFLIFPMDFEAIYEYQGHEYTGQTLQRWINDPSFSALQECKIQRSQLKLHHLQHLLYQGEPPYHPLQVQDFGVKRLEGWSKLSIIELDPHGLPPRERINVWQGLTAPGILVIEEIKRKHGPYMSEISQAVYENSFPLESLKQVFMLDVENVDTVQFVSQRLYTTLNGLEWPDETIRYWEYGTPEFKGLLGTKIGKVVAHFVLGAFERGTRRIVRIGTSFMFDFLQMRFDIEEIRPIVLPHPSHVIGGAVDGGAQLSEGQRRWMANWAFPGQNSLSFYHL